MLILSRGYLLLYSMSDVVKQVYFLYIHDAQFHSLQVSTCLPHYFLLLPSVAYISCFPSLTQNFFLLPLPSFHFQLIYRWSPIFLISIALYSSSDNNGCEEAPLPFAPRWPAPEVRSRSLSQNFHWANPKRLLLTLDSIENCATTYMASVSCLQSARIYLSIC